MMSAGEGAEHPGHFVAEQIGQRGRGLRVLAVTRQVPRVFARGLPCHSEAMMLEIAYTHLRKSEPVRIRQAVRIARKQPSELMVDVRAELVCWGVMPSGMLPHPLFVRWSSDRPKLRTT